MKTLFIALIAIIITLPMFATANNNIDEWVYEAKMPMHPVYPRPDCETEKHARHRWAHTNMPYEIPIGIQGGAWPFTYKLIEGPDGAKIGSDVNSDNYGVISWTPSENATGEKKFRVRVVDKVGNNVDITWTTIIDNSQFVFVEDGYAGNKKGTISEPLEDISDWYRGDRSDKTYHNKIIVFRNGEYNLIGGEATNRNVRLDTKTKTPTLIGFPGENAVIDASQAKIFTDLRKMTDIFVADIHWKNSRQDVGNAHFFWAIGDVTRSTWWRNKFSNHGPGTKGNDNPAAVFISNTSKHKKNILYKANIHDQFYNGRLNGSYVDIYFASYVLIEENRARNSNNGCGFLAKGTASFVSIRANHVYDNVAAGGICVGYIHGVPVVPHDHEVSWNRIVLTDKSPLAQALLFTISKGWEGKSYNSYIYRNTFVNGSAWVRFKGRENFEVDGNVVVNDALSKWNENVMKTSFMNLTGTHGDYITDDEGRLVGFAEEYKGKVGFELK